MRTWTSSGELLEGTVEGEAAGGFESNIVEIRSRMKTAGSEQETGQKQVQMGEQIWTSGQPSGLPQQRGTELSCGVLGATSAIR